MTRITSVGMVLILTLLTTGCETMVENNQSSSSRSSAAIKKYPVEIISDPSGVVVEINDNYVGKTPVTVELEGWSKTRTFSRRHKIVAHPLKSGGYTQTKVFTGWSEPSVTYGDTIPEKIY